MISGTTNVYVPLDDKTQLHRAFKTLQRELDREGATDERGTNARKISGPNGR
jgi:hypothetical protein